MPFPPIKLMKIKGMTMLKAGKNVRKLVLSYTAGENVN